MPDQPFTIRDGWACYIGSQLVASEDRADGDVPALIVTGDVDAARRRLAPLPADTRTAAIDVAIMTTARDAVMDAYRPCTISSPHAAAVLAALGIPPDTPTDDIRAGLALLRISGTTEGPCSLVCIFAGVPTWEARHETRYGGLTWAAGSSPAAAVLALAARLEERDDA